MNNVSPPPSPPRYSLDMKRLSVFLCVNIGNNSHFRRCSLFSVHTPQINQIRIFFFFLKWLKPLTPSLPPSLLSLFFSPFAFNKVSEISPCDFPPWEVYFKAKSCFFFSFFLFFLFLFSLFYVCLMRWPRGSRDLDGVGRASPGGGSTPCPAHQLSGTTMSLVDHAHPFSRGLINQLDANCRVCGCPAPPGLRGHGVEAVGPPCPMRWGSRHPT